jgi:nitrite reductase/ring-hydroxylating ferredoxin subunit
VIAAGLAAGPSHHRHHEARSYRRGNARVKGVVVADEVEVGPAAELVPGVVRPAGRYAVGNANGERFAVTRHCRHLGADLGNGSIDRRGCLEYPWHGARYDVATGRMIRGPQGLFAKILGVDAGYRPLTTVLPLGRGDVVERGGAVFVRKQHR